MWKKERSMHITSNHKLEMGYPRCRAALGPDAWERVLAACADNQDVETFPEKLETLAEPLGLAGYVAELARLELALSEAKERQVPTSVEELAINPTVRLLTLDWRNLPFLLIHGSDEPSPKLGEELVLVWQKPGTGEVRAEAPLSEDLLAMKMIVEGISAEEAGREGRLPSVVIQRAVERAVRRGVLLSPPSRIRRDPELFPTENMDERFVSTDVFTLQWHITQSCDLNCKHCYDRSERFPVPFPEALGVLEDFRAFCEERNVRGQVSFSGGNPLLYPRFTELYRAASEQGLDMAILGNPTSRKRIEELFEIQEPAFFQVSLEGLREHNDEIRGEGHFDRTMEFLDVLLDLGVYSMVMLTLTKDNMEQVLPLAEALRGRVDLFTFNRLSLVGEGANLALPSKEAFIAFLERYTEAAKHNPVMGLKDNLLNIIQHRKGIKLFGGCTGYGCGAAFNFISVLPDGEAHACRKFPSLIGNVFHESIAEIYDSDVACRYRAGSGACRNCAIRPVCGGCLSIGHSFGLDVFEDRDPFCFMEG
jgi:selenobiotic family peptide radical SAM maturase